MDFTKGRSCGGSLAATGLGARLGGGTTTGEACDKPEAEAAEDGDGEEALGVEEEAVARGEGTMGVYTFGVATFGVLPRSWLKPPPL